MTPEIESPHSTFRPGKQAVACVSVMIARLDKWLHSDYSIPLYSFQ